MHKSSALHNEVDGAGVFAAGGCKDCNVFPHCTLEAPCEACPATSCYALLDWRSNALALSLSLSLSLHFTSAGLSGA